MSGNHKGTDLPSTCGDDPLATLHKMSTTAGLSSQEYVAINTPSVAALLLGLASALAILDPVWLIVPVAAVISGIVAVHQVRNSNGTQTGGKIAILGIALAVVLAGVVGVKAVQAALGARADRQAIIALIQRLGERVKTGVSTGQWDEAYALFTDRFKGAHSRGEFIARWKGYEIYGGVQSMEWNKAGMKFQAEPQGGTDIANAHGRLQAGQGRGSLRDDLAEGGQ